MPKQKSGLRPIPEFASEAEERRFWETHDSTAYVDWSKATFVRFPNLKPSTETISLRLPAPLLDDLKALANKRDVPYQSLLKVFVADRVAAEWRAATSPGAVQPALAADEGARAKEQEATEPRAPSRLKRKASSAPGALRAGARGAARMAG